MDMKKMFMVFLILATGLVSGCSLLDGANETINYVDKATKHIDTLRKFSEEAPQMIKEAATNADLKKELEVELTVLKEEIAAFNQIETPALAKDIHQKIIEKNKEIETAINEVIVNGELVIEKIENSQLFQLINDVTRLMDQIENLGL